MRHLLKTVTFAALFISTQVFASEATSLSVSTNAMKIGWNSEMIKPSQGVSETQRESYLDVLGMSAEDNTLPFLELGLHHGKTALYFIPFGNRGEREIWAGYEVSEGLEVGFTYAGFSRKFSPARKDTTSKLNSEQAGRIGLFSIYGFQLAEQPLELTTVPYIKYSSRRFDDSTMNETVSGYGANIELMHLCEVTKNLSVGFGVSLDWEKLVSKTDNKENQTITTTDVGLQLGRVNFTF